jgi:hypothetical protein
LFKLEFEKSTSTSTVQGASLFTQSHNLLENSLLKRIAAPESAADEDVAFSFEVKKILFSTSLLIISE